MTSRFGQRLIKQPLINFGTASIDASAHIADLTIHFTEASIDHTAILNIGINSHAAIDTHIADAILHFTEASIDHVNILNIGTNSHAAIDTHIADTTLHFTEASIDHTAILNIGTNTHAAIDTHIALATVHFTEGSIDHTAILNIGTNTHAAIDTHIADSAIHFVQGGLNDLTDVTLTTPVTGGILYKSAGDWLDTDAIVVVPTGAVTLNFNALKAAATTAAGLDIFDTSGVVPILALKSSAGAKLLEIFSDGTNTSIRNFTDGGTLILRGDNAASVNTIVFQGDPDGAAKEYFAGTAVTETLVQGLKVGTGTPGDGGIVLFLELERPWVFEQESSGATSALRLRASVDNKIFNIASPNVSNTAFSVLVSNTAANQEFGVFGSRSTQAAAYTRLTPLQENRTLLASAGASAQNNNNVLAALIADLQAYGILG